MAECPPCLGRGQITGPRSVSYQHDPEDPFNAEVRVCDECEGTGVVTALRRAGLLAVSEQHVQKAINAVLGQSRDAAVLGDPRRAIGAARDESKSPDAGRVNPDDPASTFRKADTPRRTRRAAAFGDEDST